ncbi:MSMEG_0570 family nitrogen starvation response protein [Acidimangrovimonas sediminis]|uniref:MSMEG_0570 family nitrogen starvation response protein n=1 Tax=Acidimangrovimonas sediminis TaxID=2056283 RepID=UPI000C804AA9|nr:MSMEG_0570 family nitrogen starvation response protein [Acidimangrovimonas sediminis]
MPETFWTVRWPDGAEERLYSPSTIIATAFTPGETYSVADFLDRSRTALNTASERVQRKYGYHCSSAMDQLARIEDRLSAFEANPEARITCVKITQ